MMNILKSIKFKLLYILILFILFIYISKLFHLTKNNEDDKSYFKPAITLEEQEKFYTLLKVFQKALEIENITYFLSHGSYIGALRHHGMIPWDDDIDVYVDGRCKVKLKQSLTKHASQYKLQVGEQNLLDKKYAWKLYDPNSAHSYWHHSFTWPNIDIFFYHQNSTHVYDEIGELTMRIRDLFPLKRRPFGLTLIQKQGAEHRMKESLWIPVICQPAELSFMQVCKSRSYSHFHELPIFPWNQKSIDCQWLLDYYPFVFRQNVIQSNKIMMTNVLESTLNYSVHEELRIGKKKIYDLYFINEPLCDGDHSKHLIPFEIKKHSSHLTTNYLTYFIKGFRITYV